ncbi:MAG: right-handed parallel beta-helix repeat-containing protein [Cyanobacteria bacterium P01_F01_bin.53]
MTTYYVSTTGADSAARDGLSWETAWSSLSYASDRVPEGDHLIQLGAGTFTATETARPKSGITIAGMREGDGPSQTQLIASSDWLLSADPSGDADGNSGELANEYLIAFRNAQDITIRDLTLASHPDHHITGAINVWRSRDIAIHDLSIKNFRWSGLHLAKSRRLNIHNNILENASTQKFRFSNGLIRTRFIKNSDIHHNTIISTFGPGYGYKGGDHENVRIQHNTFSLEKGFAIEIAHSNEYGVEISHNKVNQVISIPKDKQSKNPNDRGYEYTFWIHHNELTDSYAIEGPRNHLRLSHNHIRIEEPGGRVYTHHFGVNNGPVWIHNNVIENVDRGLVWMNRGLAKNIFVYNNTVTFANAGDRAGAVLGVPDENKADRGLENWVVRNNILIAPENQPRKFFRNIGDSENITAIDNIVVNLRNVPDGNYSDVDPGFSGRGERPFPFYSPANGESFMVDKGADVGFPFVGAAPDVGAYELGAEASPAPIGMSLVLPGLLIAAVPLGLFQWMRSR